MNRRGIEKAPYIFLFILFGTYGGVLLVILTAFFCPWSGMASIGTLYLLYPAPAVILAGVILLARRRQISSFHRAAIVGGVAYFPLWLLGWITVLIVAAKMK